MWHTDNMTARELHGYCSIGLDVKSVKGLRNHGRRDRYDRGPASESSGCVRCTIQSLDSGLVATRYVFSQARMHLSAYMARARIVGGGSKREG